MTTDDVRGTGTPTDPWQLNTPPGSSAFEAYPVGGLLRFGRTEAVEHDDRVAPARLSDAILDATATLVAEQGLLSVTMSRIAEGAGIGRATLYKYFPDVEAILIAGHERQVGVHVQRLTAIRDRAGPAAERLESVLQAYAFIDHDHHGTELAALVHRSEHVAHAHDQLRVLVRDLIA